MSNNIEFNAWAEPLVEINEDDHEDLQMDEGDHEQVALLEDANQADFKL